MTREELIEEINGILSIHGRCPGPEGGICLEEIIPDVLEHLSTPAPLKRWTAEDGTPPKGLYLTKLSLGGRVVRVDGALVEVVSDRSVHSWASRPDVLYSPIDDEGGAE